MSSSHIAIIIVSVYPCIITHPYTLKKKTSACAGSHPDYSVGLYIESTGEVSFGTSYHSPNYTAAGATFYGDSGWLSIIQSRAPVIAIGYT